MLNGIVLSIGSIFFGVLLTIVYFTQNRPKTTRSKLYSILLVTNLFLGISEIVAFICLKSINNPILVEYPKIIDIINKIHWICGIVFFLELYLYSVVFFSSNENISLKKLRKSYRKINYSFILAFISIILIIFLSFDYYDNGTISFIPGVPAAYTLFVGTLYIMNIFIYGAKNFALLSKEAKKYMVNTIVISLAVLLFQLLDKSISFFPIGLTVIVISLYFMVENPEIYVIKELEKVKAELEKSNRAKNEFLSNLSHEIRTPMNSIVGLSENLIHSDTFNEQATRQDIENIATAGNNLLEIIDNILDISKVESGKEELNLKEYSLATIVKELASIVIIRIGERPIKFVVDIANNIPNKLLGDATKISQVLLNIVNNSVKYTEIGKIKLTITCDSDKETTKLHFRISDTGYGIKPEDYDKLFTKFNRLSDATNKEIEGTGLGLALTKKYVDLMNGKIWFESEYQAGTTFYVDLPQKIIDNSKIKFDTTKAEDDELKFINCSGKKALIVDDNKLNLVVAARLLEPYNFEVKTSKSGKDCVNEIKKGHKYDIIFLDHMMPGMDGIEVLKILRKLNDHYEIPPVVALTANAISGMKERYLKAGFNEYLSKPIDIKELNKIILKYIEPTEEAATIELPEVKEESSTVPKEEPKPEEKKEELGVLERLRMRE